MQKFQLTLRGEDHLEFTIELEAGTRSEANDDARIRYPDASILSCHTQDELRSLEQDRYHHMQMIYDDPMYDEYDW